MPHIEVVHRFANAPCERDGRLKWDLRRIESGVMEGLRACAQLATEGVASIAVDGWGVDYVRVDASGRALDAPFCYRDERTVEAERRLHERISPQRLREITGLQLQRIDTLYQLFADRQERLPSGKYWQNLPEYLLTRLGASAVSEFTNATHTQMIDLNSGCWSEEIFAAAELDRSLALPLVPAGTVVGKLISPLADLPAFRDTALIAPACHDTASAIAGIPAAGRGWGYISSGTWSLVGKLLDTPINNAMAVRENFTNLGAVGGKVCFHTSVNGMWLLMQCMESWAAAGRAWTMEQLVDAAEQLGPVDHVLDLSDPSFLGKGQMPQRINSQRRRLRHSPLEESVEHAPHFANLIFRSLAARYADAFQHVEAITGQPLHRIYIVGGASQNRYLNDLTAEATGIPVLCGSPESSTLGNFAVQLAVLQSATHLEGGAHAADVARWATVLSDTVPVSSVATN
jgi:rhamnulokinase